MQSLPDRCSLSVLNWLQGNSALKAKPITRYSALTPPINEHNSFRLVAGCSPRRIGRVSRICCIVFEALLVLRASKNPHADLVDHLGVQFGQGITGWVAEHREPVAIAANASNDPRFKAFKNLPEDHFEAMLCTPILCASKVVGVINLQHRLTYQHSANEVLLLSMLGFLVGAEIEPARLESENGGIYGPASYARAFFDEASGMRRVHISGLLFSGGDLRSGHNGICASSPHQVIGL
jgi:GAF domain